MKLDLNYLHAWVSSDPAQAVPYIAGSLQGAYLQPELWALAVHGLREHSLHDTLLLDPYSNRAYHKPRGYAGDATLIDLVYSRRCATETCDLGKAIFAVSTGIQAADGVRLRRDYAEAQLSEAHKSGKRILSLACGHFREARPLIGHDLTNITVVDQDGASLDVVRGDHGDRLNIVEANVIHFLRAAASAGEQWDYVYTLGLTDYFEDRVMTLFHDLLAKVLAPDGTAMLANFVPDHLSVGWMEAVMDWHLIYRTEQDLATFARNAGLMPRTWIDQTGAIAFCEMRRER